MFSFFSVFLSFFCFFFFCFSLFFSVSGPRKHRTLGHVGQSHLNFYHMSLTFQCGLTKLTIENGRTRGISLKFPIHGKQGGTEVCHLLQDLKVPGSNLDKDIKWGGIFEIQNIHCGGCRIPSQSKLHFLSHQVWDIWQNCLTFIWQWLQSHPS